MPITEYDLSAVKDQTSLFAFLRDKLGWPLDPEDLFTYEGPALTGDVADRAQVGRLVRFAGDAPFAIFLVEFASAFRRGDLREILRRIREQIRTSPEFVGRGLEEIVFLCATNGYAGMRFARFEAPAGGTQPRLRVFGFDREHADVTRTLREVNLPALAMPRENLLGEPDWAEGRRRWMSAWDVEAVTGAFFRRYSEVFAEVQERYVHDVVGDVRMFTQRLFNRLMFIHFLSKKPEGWLRFNGDSDYLNALWKGRDTTASFYFAHLCPLFFTALNNPHVRNTEHDNPALFSRIGNVPYLNGGLFEKAEDDTTGETVDDRAFELIINELFNRYNFTVHESTPDDIDVAVDPEMLGKVFEELVTGRHKTGSYYTPRGIVQFMCREALIGYLGGYEGLVDRHDASEITVQEARQLLAKLGEVKVVDPACGSGAYLLGMLHELHAINRLLDTRAEEATPRDDYQRKLAIIRNNIYGVDIDKFAVEIARLRLWLSLVVEHEGDTPEPLPNLDYKVECGDSLLAPSPQVSVGNIDMFRLTAIAEYDRKKAEHSDPYNRRDKSEVRKEIDELRSQIAELQHPGVKVPGFDWRLEFAEVFEKGEANGKGCGFDIVLANPPYVNSGELTATMGSEYKSLLVGLYSDTGSGTADLYVYFYDRGLQLLRSGGMFVYISSNKWFKAAYGTKLRAHIASTTTILSITDFGELKVFAAAATFPMIFVARKTPPEGSQIPTFTQVKSLEPPYPDVERLIEGAGLALPQGAIEGAGWVLADERTLVRHETMKKRGVLLGDIIGSQIYRGILTGFNQAFVIDSSTRKQLIAKEPSSAEIIKPMAIGDDVRKWRIRDKSRWLIVTTIGVDMSRYRAVMEHLAQYESKLRARLDQGSHWWELRACAYYGAFERPKVVYPEIGKERRFAFDSSGIFLNNKAFIIPNASYFLLGLLNSRQVWRFLELTCSPIGDVENDGRLELRTIYVSKVPIVVPGPSDEHAISELVRQILELKSEYVDTDVSALESEIDERVEFLYFHQAGEETYDQWKARLAAEAGTEVGAVRAMIELGETSLVEFKQSLEYVDPQSPDILRVLVEEARSRKLAEIRRSVVHSALKSVCGFLNAAGGTLLVGVHDKLGVFGIEPDYKLFSSPKDQDFDGWERKFRDLLDKRLNRRPIGLVEFSFPRIDGKTVARVEVKRSREAFYLDNVYFVRDGNRTIVLEADERDKWVEGQRTGG